MASFISLAWREKCNCQKACSSERTVRKNIVRISSRTAHTGCYLQYAVECSPRSDCAAQAPVSLHRPCFEHTTSASRSYLPHKMDKFVKKRPLPYASSSRPAKRAMGHAHATHAKELLSTPRVIVVCDSRVGRVTIFSTSQHSLFKRHSSQPGIPI